MPEDKIIRRLTTIFAADVEGFTRLMRADEEATYTTLAEYRNVIDELITRHDGRVFNTGGDSVLSEFNSVVEAVRCAIACQEEISNRNSALVDDRMLLFRIGINIGDVMVVGGDLLGDGVNVAARLEGLAEPGGICLSGNVFEQLRHKLSIDFEDMGQQEVKNIADPIHVYRVIIGDIGSSPILSNNVETTKLPDKPSLAVLPFDNMSGDLEDEYFADGISEDLITALSNVRSFIVIDRSSSFNFKGQSVSVKDIGRRLGVRYVLKGSVRKAKDKVRVSAQLVEAATSKEVWAARLDGELHDVFDLQDKIVANVVGALEPQLLRIEVERIQQKRPENFDAYDLTLCGLAHMNKLTPEDTAASLDYFRRASEADPNYARAYCCASWCYRRQVQLKGMVLSEQEKAEAIRLGKAALQADNTDPYVLWQVGLTVALVEQDIDAALSLIDRSLAANPNSNRAWLASALVRTFIGDPETVIEHTERAMQLSPLDTAVWVGFGLLANAHLQLTNYEDAVIWGRRSVQLHRDNLPAHLALIASLALTGKQLEAETALTELRTIEHNLTLASIHQRFPIVRYQNLQSFIRGLSKAGLSA